MKTVYILQGLPGSGKSTLADIIGRCLDGCGWAEGSYCSADLFFHKEGKYEFDASKLGQAHEWCYSNFIKFLEAGYTLVIVDNTNTTKKEYQKYVDAAKMYGYRPVLLTVNNFMTDEELSKTNIHGVPVESIARMRKRMKDGLSQL